MKHPLPIIAINDNSLQGPVFHPGNPGDEQPWTAGNLAASELQGVLLVWKNMVSYFNLSSDLTGYLSKLQVKAGLCELKTLVDILPQLHSTVMKQPKYDKKGLRPYISLSQKEMYGACSLYKIFNSVKNNTLKDLQKIRNNIGAHFSDAQIHPIDELIKKNDKRSTREKITWDEISALWDLIDISKFTNLLSSIEDYVNYVNKLPIHEWYRYEKSGKLRTHIPLTGYVDEHGSTWSLIISESLAKSLGLNKDDLIEMSKMS
ncbi:hypothetical protein [Yersinia rochesterensis]|uniref:hypothetical protein n=1 Tax=Yersinia rochesterensis TaxID=1604335 RepID=UPI0011A161BB|nr:hypothetical protein [Yersinia rochesterensis]